MDIADDMVLTSAVVCSCTAEEYDEAAERFGDTPEMSTFVGERLSDLFLILSAPDTYGLEETEQYLSSIANTGGRGFSLDLSELGRADGWVFYSVTGDGVIRRPEPVPGTELFRSLICSKKG